jgi:hypothetical protein
VEFDEGNKPLNLDQQESELKLHLCSHKTGLLQLPGIGIFHFYLVLYIKLLFTMLNLSCACEYFQETTRIPHKGGHFLNLLLHITQWIPIDLEAMHNKEPASQ